MDSTSEAYNEVWKKVLAQAKQDIPLAELASGKKKARLCVDGAALGRALTFGHDEWIYGGQWLSLREQIDEFVTHLKVSRCSCALLVVCVRLNNDGGRKS